MDVLVTHHTISITRGENGLLTEQNLGRVGAICNFRIATEAWFRLDPYYDPKLAEFEQFVNTAYKKYKRGHIVDEVNTLWRDDRYTIADGVWGHDGRSITVLDHPGIEVFGGELLDYTFMFRQRFYHRLFRSTLTESPIITVTMKGTYDAIVMGGQYNYVWQYSRPIDPDDNFRTDAEF